MCAGRDMSAAAEMASTAGAGKGKEKAEESAAAAAAGENARFVSYPARMAEREGVVADAALFRAALEKLHAHMGTKLKVPIIGGKDLDLHQLFKEVTSRGGIDKVKAENRWREVTGSFVFPATATNASFMLKKYYMSLLYHFEQLYFFGAQGWYQQESDPRTLSCIEVRAETQTTQKRKRVSHAPSDPASSSDTVDVDVVIDGKFEHGYIVTVIMGSKSTKAVLYNCTEEPALPTLAPTIPINNTDLKGGRRRRRRRKKLSTTDPRHPKPNRSGYNFFFQDQHRKLKPEYPGQDRLISKMIGERWNSLSTEDKAVYQERGVQDKERYQTQLAAYREEVRTGQHISNSVPSISNVVPIQQRFPQAEVTIDEVDSKVSKGDMLLSSQGHNSSDESDDSSGGKIVEDDEFNTETSPEPSMETTDSPGQFGPCADGDQFELRRRENPKENEEQNTPPN